MHSYIICPFFLLCIYSQWKVGLLFFAVRLKLTQKILLISKVEILFWYASFYTQTRVNRYFKNIRNLSITKNVVECILSPLLHPPSLHFPYNKGWEGGGRGNVVSNELFLQLNCLFQDVASWQHIKTWGIFFVT